jgi:hypothetical protein
MYANWDITSQTSLLPSPCREEHKQGSNGFAVADFARGNKSGDFLQGNADQLDIVSILSHETAGHKVGG